MVRVLPVVVRKYRLTMLTAGPISTSAAVKSPFIFDELPLDQFPSWLQILEYFTALQRREMAEFSVATLIDEVKGTFRMSVCVKSLPSSCDAFVTRRAGWT